eukprot:SM000053S17408  [mRNA]  locus=s53:259600:260668:+ [translate_table: standard]
MSGKVLFEDIFAVRDVDPGGKKFDKVSRFIGHSEQFDMDLLLDVNVDAYPLQRDDKFALALAPTLNLDGSQDEGFFDQVSLPAACPSRQLQQSRALQSEADWVSFSTNYMRASMFSRLLLGSIVGCSFSGVEQNLLIVAVSLQSKKKSLMDQYEYVTYGKLYQWGGLEGSKAEVHISYGGLLMRLAGDMSHLKDLKLDQRLYCLIRRVS